MDTRVSITLEEGKVLFEEDLIVLNSMITAAQKGVDPYDGETGAIWSSRLAAHINDKYKLEITPTHAWLIASFATARLEELKANFFQGLKSLPSTDSTPPV